MACDASAGVLKVTVPHPYVTNVHKQDTLQSAQVPRQRHVEDSVSYDILSNSSLEVNQD